MNTPMGAAPERTARNRRVLGLAIWLCVCAMLQLPGAAHASGIDAGPALHLQGKFVVFNQVGFEPDGDPLDRAVISGTLRGEKPGGVRELTLILSMYLENFLPRTAPELPDLLRPDQAATSLAGFFQGKAALVGSDGHVAFWGSVLAEAFFDNSVHIAISLAREGAPADEPALTLLGSFTVDGSLTLAGTLHVTDGLTPPATAALEAGGLKRMAVSWQAVIKELTVSVPRMMGSGGTGTPAAAGTPADMSSSFARSALRGHEKSLTPHAPPRLAAQSKRVAGPAPSGSVQAIATGPDPSPAFSVIAWPAGAAAGILVAAAMLLARRGRKSRG